MSDLMGKTKSEVEEELGPPLHVTQWDSSPQPEDLHGAALEAWRGSELHSIWVYPGQVISFNVKGEVRHVGTDSDLYLTSRPPVA